MKFSKKKLSKFLDLFIFVCLIGVGLGAPRFIKINVVECESQFGPCSSEVSDRLSAAKGKSLSDGKKQITSYLKSETKIHNFSIRFKLPGILVVSVLEEKSRFALFGGGVYAGVSEDGEVLTLDRQSALPFIKTTERLPNLGEKVPETTLFALKLQERLFAAYQVNSGELGKDYLAAHLPYGFTVFFPLTGDSDQLLGALSLIIYELNKPAEASRIDTTISTIDLRFANPVLR